MSLFLGALQNHVPLARPPPPEGQKKSFHHRSVRERSHVPVWAIRVSLSIFLLMVIVWIIITMKAFAHWSASFSPSSSLSGSLSNADEAVSSLPSTPDNQETLVQTGTTQPSITQTETRTPTPTQKQNQNQNQLLPLVLSAKLAQMLD